MKAVADDVQPASGGDESLAKSRVGQMKIQRPKRRSTGFVKLARKDGAGEVVHVSFSPFSLHCIRRCPNRNSSSILSFEPSIQSTKEKLDCSLIPIIFGKIQNYELERKTKKSGQKILAGQSIPKKEWAESIPTSIASQPTVTRLEWSPR